MTVLPRCPACAAPAPPPFFTLEALPVHGAAVLPDPVAARAVAVGDQRLVLCEHCGLVFNCDFDDALLDYAGEHEESQHHSPRFAAYAAEITKAWVDGYELAGRHVVEVGCGSGDFAEAMLEAGVGSVTGVDPHFTHERARSHDALTAVPEFFAARHVEPGTAALVCRHTLEHIAALATFGAEIVAGMRRGGTRWLLAEVPDLGRILTEGAFWDLQYEHCSYFTPATMAGYLGRLGFVDPLVRTTYADQYVVAEAQLGDGWGNPAPIAVAELDRLHGGCAAFAARVSGQVGRWRDWLDEQSASGDAVVVWGGGSKGLTFLNVVARDADPAVRAVVDINPGLQGSYMAGLGLPIWAPDELRAAPPRSVLLMNPVYLGEVRAMLDERGLRSTELLAV